MQENDEETTTKMPLLGDIPILGWLFKTNHVSKNKTNLIVFLNPHVIQNPERLADITREKRQEFAVANGRYSEGELLVSFKEGVSDEQARSLIAEKGASVISVVPNMNVYHIRLKEGESVEEGIKDFQSLPEVRYAEPNYILKLK